MNIMIYLIAAGFFISMVFLFAFTMISGYIFLDACRELLASVEKLNAKLVGDNYENETNQDCCGD